MPVGGQRRAPVGSSAAFQPLVAVPSAPSVLPLPAPQVDLTRYTLPTYMRIVTYKTAFYTFYLPVACGMRLAGVT